MNNDDEEFAVAIRNAITSGVDRAYAEVDKQMKKVALAFVVVLAFVCLAFDDWCARDLAQTWERAAKKADTEYLQLLSRSFGFAVPPHEDPDDSGAVISEADVAAAAADDEETLDDIAGACMSADGLYVFNPRRCVESDRVCDTEHDAIDLRPVLSESSLPTEEREP